SHRDSPRSTHSDLISTLLHCVFVLACRLLFFPQCSRAPQYLHSFPTRRSSDLELNIGDAVHVSDIREKGNFVIENEDDDALVIVSAPTEEPEEDAEEVDETEVEATEQKDEEPEDEE